MTDVTCIQGDITRCDVDAIVNAANSSLIAGGGVDGAIHRAGGPSIQAECDAIVQQSGQVATGNAVITSGGRLKARHVIHTVGPIWFDHEPTEAIALLASSYMNSLEMAAVHHCESVAFPSISTGAYGFPIALASHTAIDSVRTWTAAQTSSLTEVLFVCFDRSTFEIYKGGLGTRSNDYADLGPGK